MSDKNLLEFIEVDLPRCSLIYGVYPCTAVLGVTGEIKCHNSPATCQVPNAYSADDDLTVRLSVPSVDLSNDIPSIPCLNSVSTRPMESFPAKSIGTRAEINASFINLKHNDVGFDKYIDDRGFNTYLSGTFWGKFFARYPNLQGYPMRYIVGEVGQSINEMETRHYFVEGRSGPGARGNVTISGRDALKFLDGKKALAPKPSRGRLLNGIDDTETAITLTPTGIGDLDYPSSGKATAGSELVTYTRVNDDVTLTGRGLQFTDAESHDADEVFQLVLSYSAENLGTICDDLIFNYSDTPLKYANLTTWQDEVNNYYGRLLTADICRPTGVGKLISELIVQAGLHVYTDIINEKIILNVLRQKNTVLTITDEIVKPDKIKFEQDEDGRLNQVITFYGQKNPIINIDEDGNFRAIDVQIDDDPIKALEDLPLSQKIVRSRWITIENGAAAQQIGSNFIDWMGDTPGETELSLPLKYSVNHGDHVLIQSRIFEDAEGNLASPMRAIVTRMQRTTEEYRVGLRNIQFRALTDPTRIILIDVDSFAVNLRELHDTIYSAPGSGDVIRLIISENAIVGGEYNQGLPATVALDIGDWPSNVTIQIDGTGRIQGAPGEGGFGYFYSDPPIVSIVPAQGGLALYTRYPIEIISSDLEIYGGGGGGGINDPRINPGIGVPFLNGEITWGGYGQGSPEVDFSQIPPGYPGRLGTPSAPGSPPTAGGAGGIAGVAGTAGDFNAGGAAGVAIDGDSYITHTAAADIQGAQIN